MKSRYIRKLFKNLDVLVIIVAFLAFGGLISYLFYEFFSWNIKMLEGM